MVEKESYEDKEIPINVFESIQIDLKSEKLKKRRNNDDYDYNDPFLESFEGEFEAVDLECKLDNFFIYKGEILDDPKRIARKYNNNLKKTKLVDSIKSINQKDNDLPKSKNHFTFEQTLINSINPNYKYKKDRKFENFIFWIFFVQTPTSNFHKFLRLKILYFFDKKFTPENYKEPFQIDQEIETLKNEIENQFKDLQAVVSLDSSFSEDKKSFKLFTERPYVQQMISFIINYMKFYIVTTEENISYVKNSALDYLNAMLPEQCTNGIKIKHYISKVVDLMIKELGYDLESVKAGRFIKTSEIEENLPKPVKTIDNITQGNISFEMVLNDQLLIHKGNAGDISTASFTSNSLLSTCKANSEDLGRGLSNSQKNDLEKSDRESIDIATNGYNYNIHNKQPSDTQDNTHSSLGKIVINQHKTKTNESNSCYQNGITPSFSSTLLNTSQYQTGPPIKEEKSVVFDNKQNSNDYTFPIDSVSYSNSCNDDIDNYIPNYVEDSYSYLSKSKQPSSSHLNYFNYQADVFNKDTKTNEKLGKANKKLRETKATKKRKQDSVSDINNVGDEANSTPTIQIKNNTSDLINKTNLLPNDKVEITTNSKEVLPILDRPNIMPQSSPKRKKKPKIILPNESTNDLNFNSENN